MRSCGTFSRGIVKRNPLMAYIFFKSICPTACLGSLVCGTWDEWSQISDTHVYENVSVFGGLFIAGYLLSTIGRKPTIAIIGPIYTLCWTVVLIVPSVSAINFVVNLFAKISKAMTFVAIPVYVGEVAEVEYRGAALTMFTIMYTMGTTLVKVAGLTLTHYQLSVVGLLLSIVFAVLFIIAVPESPYYYAEKDLTVMAGRSLQRIRANDDFQAELADIEHTVDVHMIPNRTGFGELLTDKASWNAFSSTALAHFFQAHCGYRQVGIYFLEIRIKLEYITYYNMNYEKNTKWSKFEIKILEIQRI